MFSGIECDILQDGSMDLANDALAELDFVIGSVHSHMNLEPAEMTDRMLRALECPHCRRSGIRLAGCLCIARPIPRLRSDCRGGRAARRVVRDQCESGASGSPWCR